MKAADLASPGLAARETPPCPVRARTGTPCGSDPGPTASSSTVGAPRPCDAAVGRSSAPPGRRSPPGAWTGPRDGRGRPAGRPGPCRPPGAEPRRARSGAARRRAGHRRAGPPCTCSSSPARARPRSRSSPGASRWCSPWRGCLSGLRRPARSPTATPRSSASASALACLVPAAELLVHPRPASVGGVLVVLLAVGTLTYRRRYALGLTFDCLAQWTAVAAVHDFGGSWGPAHRHRAVHRRARPRAPGHPLPRRRLPRPGRGRRPR